MSVTCKKQVAEIRDPANNRPPQDGKPAVLADCSPGTTGYIQAKYHLPVFQLTMQYPVCMNRIDIWKTFHEVRRMQIFEPKPVIEIEQAKLVDLSAA
jgi:hypothetical protein